MVKHTQAIRQLLPMNCLSAFDHFKGLPLKGLITPPKSYKKSILEGCIPFYYFKKYLNLFLAIEIYQDNLGTTMGTTRVNSLNAKVAIIQKPVN